MQKGIIDRQQYRKKNTINGKIDSNDVTKTDEKKHSREGRKIDRQAKELRQNNEQVCNTERLTKNSSLRADLCSGRTNVTLKSVVMCQQP